MALTVLAFTCGTLQAMPADFNSQSAEARQAGLYVSNDAQIMTLGLFLDEDRYYSQGLHAFWTGSPRALEDASLILRYLGEKVHATQVTTTFRFGQDIFTPNDLRAAPPMVSDDRPFFGWTHLDYGQRFYLTTIGLPTRLLIQAEGGVIGPASFAQEIQTGYHALRRDSSPHPELDPDPSQGWAQQYGRTGFPGRVQILTDYSLALPEPKLGKVFRIESGLHAGINAGTIYGHLGAGGQIRVGRITRRLYQPQPGGNGKSWEAFGFARSDIQAVGWNLALSGAPGSQVEAAQGLWQIEFGALVRAPSPWPEISLTWTTLSRETQRDPAAPFQTGHTDYRPGLQSRSPWFDHGLGTLQFAWLW